MVGGGLNGHISVNKSSSSRSHEIQYNHNEISKINSDPDLDLNDSQSDGHANFHHQK